MKEYQLSKRALDLGIKFSTDLSVNSLAAFFTK